MISPRSVPRTRAKRVEISWTYEKFEAKSQTNSNIASWASKLMTHSDYSKKITATKYRKALNLMKSLAIDRCPEDMEFIISIWSIVCHTFIAT